MDKDNNAVIIPVTGEENSDDIKSMAIDIKAGVDNVVVDNKVDLNETNADEETQDLAKMNSQPIPTGEDSDLSVTAMQIPPLDGNDVIDSCTNSLFKGNFSH